MVVKDDDEGAAKVATREEVKDVYAEGIEVGKRLGQRLTPGGELPTVPVPLNLFELGWMMFAVWDAAEKNHPPARALYLKVKAAAIALGVEWYYGDPWPQEGGTDGT